MKIGIAYRLLVAVTVIWIVAAPFIWRANFAARLGVEIPLSALILPLALASFALVSIYFLSTTNWQSSLIFAIAAATFGIFGLLRNDVFVGGTVFNALLLMVVAGIPAAMHFNNAFKRRRTKSLAS